MCAWVLNIWQIFRAVSWDESHLKEVQVKNKFPKSTTSGEI